MPVLLSRQIYLNKMGFCSSCQRNMRHVCPSMHPWRISQMQMMSGKWLAQLSALTGKLSITKHIPLFHMEGLFSNTH